MIKLLYSLLHNNSLKYQRKKQNVTQKLHYVKNKTEQPHAHGTVLKAVENDIVLPLEANYLREIFRIEQRYIKHA